MSNQIFENILLSNISDESHSIQLHLPSNISPREISPHIVSRESIPRKTIISTTVRILSLAKSPSWQPDGEEWLRFSSRLSTFCPSPTTRIWQIRIDVEQKFFDIFRHKKAAAERDCHIIVGDRWPPV